MPTTHDKTDRLTIAKPLAPEDLARGDYVALLSVACDYPLIVWLCDPMASQQGEVVRLKHTTDLCREPLRVRSVCLPFVLVKRPSGLHATLDVRSCELARLSEVYGRRAWKALTPKKPSRAKRRRNKRKR